MNNAEVDFYPACEDKPLGQNAPVPRAEERRVRQRLDPVTAVDVLVRVCAEHVEGHNFDLMFEADGFHQYSGANR